MKKTKVIIPALAVMLLSTAASVSGTVAWFSMNNFVTASGMNIQAKAENGIVISNEAKSEWKESAIASHTAAIDVYPTSTANAGEWAHSASNNADSATSNGSYSVLDLNEDMGTNGVGGTGRGYVDEDDDDAYDAGEATYYLKNSFFIKSSAEEIEKTIYITNVYASVTGTSYSGELNKSLRVLVKSGTTAKVFAPVSGATLSYNYKGATAVTAISSAATEGHVPAASQSFLGNHTIPAYGDTPTQIDIYVYFEGEDANCKSTNLDVTSLDTLNVSVKFGLESVADA